MNSSRALVAVQAFLWASVALACPVCGQGVKEAQTAYIVMTFVMSLLPLGMIFGLAYFVYRRVKQSASQELLGACPRN